MPESGGGPEAEPDFFACKDRPFPKNRLVKTGHNGEEKRRVFPAQGNALDGINDFRSIHYPKSLLVSLSFF